MVYGKDHLLGRDLIYRWRVHFSAKTVPNGLSRGFLMPMTTIMASLKDH